MRTEASSDCAGQRTGFDVGAAAAGQRLDRFLTERLGSFTRSFVKRLIEQGQVLVDGRSAAKAGLRLEPGMRVETELPPPPAEAPAPEGLPLAIVHEDEALLVLDKAAGVVVHPARGHPGGTVVNALLGRAVRLAASGGPWRPGIVHRLDRGTSGLLVVAKTDAAWGALTSAFSRREVRKEYLALVWGHPEPERGTLDRAIGRSRSDRSKMALRGSGGRAAVTHYRVVERLPGFALLSIRPETGRTHQIRVHLQSIHHPVVGDTNYGGRRWRGVMDPRKRKTLREFDRLALHACRLGFVHPLTGQALELEARLPAEFERLLDVLRVG